MSSNNSSNKKIVYGKLCSQQLERQNIKDSLLADIESEVESEHESVEQLENSKKIKIMSPEVCLALDRTKISDRKATYLIAAATYNIEIKLKKTVLSRQSIRRCRQKAREEVACNIKEKFKVQSKLVVQWDGKHLPDLLDKNKKVIAFLFSSWVPVSINCSEFQN